MLRLQIQMICASVVTHLIRPWILHKCIYRHVHMRAQKGSTSLAQKTLRILFTGAWEGTWGSLVLFMSLSICSWPLLETETTQGGPLVSHSGAFCCSHPTSPTVWTQLISSFLMSTLWSFGKKTRRRRRLYRKALQDCSRQQVEHHECICWRKGSEFWKRMEERERQARRKERTWERLTFSSTSTYFSFIFDHSPKLWVKALFWKTFDLTAFLFQNLRSAYPNKTVPKVIPTLRFPSHCANSSKK